MHTLVALISCLLLSGYALLILYYRIQWGRIPEYRPADKELQHPVSITLIIPARNEEERITRCLQSIRSQHYPAAHLQVIVVDDHSNDRTAELVREFEGLPVELIHLADHPVSGQEFAYKKRAISLAINKARGELIVTTDADCTAASGWLHMLSAFYRETGALCMVMPVRYPDGGGLLHRFQLLDFLALQGITGAAVHSATHSMCNGANLAYTKAVFESVGGFSGIDHIASGDDMLLLHKIYQQFPGRVAYVKSPDVIVTTQPPATLREFFRQRIRWASKASHFQDRRIFLVLLLVYVLNVWILALMVAALFSAEYRLHALLLVVVKTSVELLFLWRVADFFSCRAPLFWFPFAQPFHVLYTVISGWLGKFGRYSWKGRTVR